MNTGYKDTWMPLYGGSWLEGSRNLRSAYYDCNMTFSCDSDVSFRIILRRKL